MQKKITIYTTDYCPYCKKAKALLIQKNLSFEEVDVNTPELKDELVKKANGLKTVPQIFIDEFHVGGCDDLYAMNQSGELDKKLNA